MFKISTVFSDRMLGIKPRVSCILGKRSFSYILKHHSQDIFQEQISIRIGIRYLQRLLSFLITAITCGQALFFLVYLSNKTWACLLSIEFINSCLYSEAHDWRTSINITSLVKCAAGTPPFLQNTEMYGYMVFSRIGLIWHWAHF